MAWFTGGGWPLTGGPAVHRGRWPFTGGWPLTGVSSVGHRATRLPVIPAKETHALRLVATSVQSTVCRAGLTRAGTISANISATTDSTPATR
jgi:hypothetical protein